MDKIFELYCGVTGETVSYHKTFVGALKAMSEKVNKEAPGLLDAFGDDKEINVRLEYWVKSIPVSE